MRDFMTQAIAYFFVFAVIRLFIGDEQRNKFKAWIEAQPSGRQLSMVGLLFLWSFVAVFAIAACEKNR